jgi:hypothetical protein
MRLKERLDRLRKGDLDEKHGRVERHRMRKEFDQSLERIKLIAENWDLVKPKHWVGIYGSSSLLESSVETALTNVAGRYLNDVYPGREGMSTRICADMLDRADTTNVHWMTKLPEWARLKELVREWSRLAEEK